MLFDTSPVLFHILPVLFDISAVLFEIALLILVLFDINAICDIFCILLWGGFGIKISFLKSNQVYVLSFLFDLSFCLK